MTSGTQLWEPPSVIQEHDMHRIRPRTTVLSGATIGLIAGAAVYGAISSSATAPAPTAFKPVSATRAIAPARPSAAPCAKGQKLVHGVCIVHVVHTVVVPAAGSGSYPGSGASVASPGAATPASHEGASEAEPGDDAAEQAHEAAEHAAEQAHEAAKHAKEAAAQTTANGS